MNIPNDLYYTEDHEWVKIEEDIATIGITEYAQGELGDIVYIEQPQIGQQTKQFESCGTIEAVKTVSDIYAPLSGEIIEVNDELEENPQIVNKDSYGQGWLFKLKCSDLKELNNLLRNDDYKKLIG